MDNRIYPTRWDSFVMWWRGITIEELYFKREFPGFCFKHRVRLDYESVCNACVDDRNKAYTKTHLDEYSRATKWEMPKAWEWPPPPPRNEGDLP